jgi:ABC-type oligopeptide transport system substrate-binding subunit
VHKPPLLALAALVAGTSLIVAAATGSATTRLRQGGTLRVELPIYDIDDIDPSTAYGRASWHIEYSTALKLLNYPDAPAPRGSRLVPEGASSFRVSRDGKTYTFTIRKGLRFSNGVRVTAKNYAYALNRAMSRDLYSPGFQFIADPKTTNIVGAQEAWDGETVAARGVRVKSNKLIVRLENPDGTFPAKLAMPFFQAIPLFLDRSRKVVDVDESRPLPSAGPYYVSDREPNRLVLLKRNPFYRGERPRRPAQINIRTAVNIDEAYSRVRSNEADYTYALPVDAAAEREFGLQGRFRVRPASCISYIAMNSLSPLFRDNPQLRRAVNYAIDRNAMVARWLYASRPTDQYLPVGFPGFVDIDAYPFGGDQGRARRLAAGHVPSGGPWPYYYGFTAGGRERMELVRRALAQIGIAIEPRVYRTWYWPPVEPDWAFQTAGWCQDYPDPYDFINVMLDGRTVGAENSNNLANFNDPVYNARMNRAARLTGAARLRAYASLDRDLVTKAAPWAAWGQPANEFFFSENVDMRSFVYQQIYEAPPYNVLALK